MFARSRSAATHDRTASATSCPTPNPDNKSWSFSALIIALVLTIALAASLLLSGCSSQDSAKSQSDEGATQTITDMRGRSVEVPTDPERIVAIGGAQRLVCYLQAQDRIVGVEASDTQDNPSCAYRHVFHELFASLPVVGDGGSSGINVNEEALMQTDAQLVVCDGLSADEADNLQQKTGIPFVCLEQPDSIFSVEYFNNIELLGKVLEKQDRASDVIAYIKGIEDDIERRSAASTYANKVSAYAAGISFRGGRGFDGTEANFQPFVVCDVANIADDRGSNGAFTIDLEAVSVAQPDFIFVECNNLPLISENYANNPAYFDALRAVQSENTYTIISYRFYSTNVELALANCYQVGSAVYPDTFEGIDPTTKLDEISEFFLGAPLSEDLAAQGSVFAKIDLTNL